MDFRGHLRLPDDAGTGIGVVLRLDDIFVIITAGDEELGAWRADDVVIERIFSNQFAIDLDGEPMVFVAQDALGFAYEGITAIEDLQARLTKRGIFRRSRKKDKKATTVEVEPQPEPQLSEQPARAPEPSRRPAAELVSHLDHPEPPETAIPVPDLEVVPDPSPTPLWTPATAKSSPAGDGVSTVDEDSPIPADHRSGSGGGRSSDERPADTRVSYPRASVPPPPAVDSFVPPTEDDQAEADASEAVPAATSDRASEPASVDAPDVAPPVPEPEFVSELELESEPEPESELEPELEPESEPETQPEPEPEPEFESAPPEPELEIEEITAAASGTAWEEADTQAAEVPEPEIEIEEYVAPTASQVDTFVAPQLEPEPVEPEPVEQVPVDELESVETETESPSGAVDEPFEPEPEPEPEPEAEEPMVASEDDSQELAVAQSEDATQEAASTNGHKTEKRRSFLFGRGRDKSVPAHDHEYGEPKTIGGLTRQVCSVCGHVTFSGQDVYQDW